MSSAAHESSVFDAHGFRFRIASPIADVIALFDDVLVDMVVELDDGSELHRFDIRPARGQSAAEAGLLEVSLDGDAVFPTLRAGSLTSHLLMEVNRRAAGSSARHGCIPLHAAAVSGAHGTVLFPGASHSGKTTMATAVAVRYCERVRFVADEVSALDPADLSIRMYGKPVALRAASVQLLATRLPRLRDPASRFQEDERFVPPSALGSRPHRDSGTVSSTATPVSAVVFPQFGERDEPSTGSRRLAPLTPGEVLERLMQSVLGVGAISAATFNELARVAASASGYELRYAHLDDVIGELAQLL